MAEIIRKTTSTEDPLNIGFMRTYYVDGKEVYREELDQNLDIKQHAGHLPDGTVKEFFENGKVYFECEVKKGQRDGVCRIYFDNGKINIEKNYKKGALDGKVKVFHPSGKLYKEFHYTLDVQDGQQIKYYPDGKFLEVSEFRKGS